MSLRSVRHDRTARAAIVGATTEDGVLLRDALEAGGIPGERVEFYSSRRGELLLSEYRGEARMIQQADVSEIVGHDVIFLCEGGEIARAVRAAANPGVLIVDLVDGPTEDAGSPDRRPEGHDGPRCLRVAHPLALLLVEVLAPLNAAFSLEEVTAVVLRPASDFGQDGADELREQTVRLLSFSQAPQEVFGRQLAFNLIPGSLLDRRGPALTERVRREVANELGWKASRLALAFLTAPLFYGHGLQLRLRLTDRPGPASIAAALSDAGLAPRETAATPLDVVGEVRTIVSGPDEDGLGGYWLWVAAGETAARGAREAVRLARHWACL